MKHIFLLFLAINLFIKPGFSQDNESPGSRILFKGLVMDATTLSPIANSQILINRDLFAISDNEGHFAFYVNINDTVLFKSLGYKSTLMFVSDTLKGIEFIAGIYMKSDTLLIGEVIIVPRVTNLKSEIMNAKSKTPAIMENARYNVAVSAYQGRTTQGKLGDPANNYAILSQQQKVNAYERGGIPSDKILGLSPFMLLPAAYLLLHGLPEKPIPMKSQLTDQEVDMIHKKYIETLKQQRE